MLVKKRSEYYLLYTKVEDLAKYIDNFLYDIEEDLGDSGEELIEKLKDFKRKIYEAQFMNRE